jgi:hypothetical protein
MNEGFGLSPRSRKTSWIGDRSRAFGPPTTATPRLPYAGIWLFGGEQIDHPTQASEFRLPLHVGSTQGAAASARLG